MSPSNRSPATRVVRVRLNGTREERPDVLSSEQPLELRLKGEGIAIVMRTPGSDRELAAGFALTEGLIETPDQLIEVSHCRRGTAEHPENIINLFLDPKTPVDLERLSRHVFASSSCGICGKASIEAIQNNWPPIESSFSIRSRTLLALPERLRKAQEQFEQTGGLHAAALFTSEGQLVCLREDVGRHNAVDKVIGWSVLNGSFPPDHHLLLVSGRTSFEIMQKALAARIPLVAAISAPSSLAVEFAQENHQTLVGFLRESTFNIYAQPQRVED